MSAPTHIYISGPMRGRDGFNFPAFMAAEAIVRETWPDADVFNPARADVARSDLWDMLRDDPTGLAVGQYLQSNPDADFDIRVALAEDMAYICAHADMILLLPEWEQSGGARAELATCQALGSVAITHFNPFGVGTITLSDGSILATGRSGGPESRSEGLKVLDDQSPADALDASEAPAGAPHASDSDLLAGEVRRTSATGGEKGSKLAAFDQISPFVEWELAEHFGMGARKYAAHNFRRGYPWSLSYSAMRRHLASFWSGKEWDECPDGCPDWKGEDRNGRRCCKNHTGSRHIIAALWHANALAEFSAYEKFKEYDDRYVYDTQD